MYIRWFVSLGKWSDFPDNIVVLVFHCAIGNLVDTVWHLVLWLVPCI